MNDKEIRSPILITAGATYLDIDAYACMVAMAELLRLRGEAAVAYSLAPCNYSICSSLIKDGQVERHLPCGKPRDSFGYVVVDVSDPKFLESSVPIERVVAIYDHHTGFEDYWHERLGDNSHIEFIGAAATLVYREWKTAELAEQMTKDTAKLLIAAVLDNTLNLTSQNTTAEDRVAFSELCALAGVDDAWCAEYFLEVQENVIADLKNALLGDMKSVRDNPYLPPKLLQISVFDANGVIEMLPVIREWLATIADAWMINIIDIKQNCSYFVCDDNYYRNRIEQVFNVHFESGVAKSAVPYLRKEIIKKTTLLKDKK